MNTARKIAHAKYAGEGVTLSPNEVARLHALIQAVGGHLTGGTSIQWVRNVLAVVEGEGTPGDNMQDEIPLLPGGEDDPAELIEAIRARVAMTFEDARAASARGEHPIYCQADMLNACWTPERGAPITLPLKHWGGGDACPDCRLRAALARVEG